MTKRRLFDVAVGALVLGGFVCYPVFAEGPVNVSVIEVVDDGSGGYKAWEDITDAMPGMTYSAIPRVKNDGSVPVRVELCLVESVINNVGDEVIFPFDAFIVNAGAGWSFNVEGSVGMRCYDYDSSLAVGGMTEPLFTEVTLNSELENEFENNTFSLHLVANAIEDGGGDEPDVPTEDPSVPGSPDTGENTFSYLENVSPLLFATGGVVLFAMLVYVLRVRGKN